MGVRSMCTHVQTPDLSVLIDAGASIHTGSSLQPHPLEYEILARKRGEILSLSRDTDLIIVSHYHLHHFSLPVNDLTTTFCTGKMSDDIFSGKALFCKDPSNMVTEVQRRRGLEFHRVYGESAPRYEVIDGRSFHFGETRISFSKPLWHGPEGTIQGYVVGTCIRDREFTIVHASDVQMLNRGCVDWMLKQEPDIAIAAGPPFFDPKRVGKEEEKIATSLLRRLSGEVTRVVIDHQALRSDDWQRFFENGGKNVLCAAQFEGQEPLPLESMREMLYKREDVEEGFHEKLAMGELPDFFIYYIGEADHIQYLSSFLGNLIPLYSIELSSIFQVLFCGQVFVKSNFFR